MPKKIIFFVILLLCVLGIVNSAIALSLGITFGIFLNSPFDSKLIKKYQTLMLQTSIVGLGAGINLVTILKQGASSIPITLIALVLIMSFGMFITRAFGFSQNFSWLLSGGTAICGGSAIAAISPAIKASDEETSISLGIVFILNSIALFIFPPLGHFLGLTEEQFGIFSALSIHDTSSVVAAANLYGAKALEIATTTKLVRALWIIPLTTAIVFIKRKSDPNSKNTGSFPKFIIFFILVSALVTMTSPQIIPKEIFDYVYTFSKHLLVGAIFLIGMQINIKNLKKLGIKTIVPALLLWIFSISISYVIMSTQM